MKVWVLTEEFNLYDQQGAYFRAVWSTKPSLGQIMHECRVGENDAAHILNGGGRVKWEDSWFFLIEQEAITGEEAEGVKHG